MKYLFIIFMCATAKAEVDMIRIDGWDKNVIVTVQLNGINYKMKTTSDEVEKYNNDKESEINKFVKEVVYANRKK